MTDIDEKRQSVQTDTKTFDGGFLLWRKVGDKLHRSVKRGVGNPRFRHPTFEAAETEAKRLATLYPESVFVIMQEIARVKAVGDLSAEIKPELNDEWFDKADGYVGETLVSPGSAPRHPPLLKVHGSIPMTPRRSPSNILTTQKSVTEIR